MRIGVAMRREMKSAPVTVAQSAVLSALLIGGAMRVSDLARNEGVKLPTMTQIVGRMEMTEFDARILDFESVVAAVSAAEVADAAEALAARLPQY